jgi:hypothetical protein
MRAFGKCEQPRDLRMTEDHELPHDRRRRPLTRERDESREG